MLSSKIFVDKLRGNGFDFFTGVPCSLLSGLIAALEADREIGYIPSVREDAGVGLCAGAYMGGRRPCIIMQNTAIGVTINTLATLIQFYEIPLPMLISYRGEVGEKVACQVEMAVHTKALLNQLAIPTFHFHRAGDVEELDGILKYTQMCKKPTAILTDATFWSAGP